VASNGTLSRVVDEPSAAYRLIRPCTSRVTRASPSKATSAMSDVGPRLGGAPPSLAVAAYPKVSPSPLTSSQATLSPETTGCSWVDGEAETVSPASSPMSGQPAQILFASKTSRAVRSTTGSSSESRITCSTAARASRKPAVGPSRVVSAAYTTRSKAWASGESLPGLPSILARLTRIDHRALFQIAELKCTPPWSWLLKPSSLSRRPGSSARR
jgi:hypothetical protein